MFGIALNIPVEFGEPVVLIGLWAAEYFAGRIRMLVPETAVNENHFPPRRKDKIRFARQISAVEPAPAQSSNELIEFSVIIACSGYISGDRTMYLPDIAPLRYHRRPNCPALTVHFRTCWRKNDPYVSLEPFTYPSNLLRQTRHHRSVSLSRTKRSSEFN